MHSARFPNRPDPVAAGEQIFAIIREPKSRIISAYLDHIHMDGMSGKRQGEVKKEMKEIEEELKATEPDPLKRKLQSVAYYAHLPDTYGK